MLPDRRRETHDDAIRANLDAVTYTGGFDDAARANLDAIPNLHRIVREQPGRGNRGGEQVRGLLGFRTHEEPR